MSAEKWRLYVAAGLFTRLQKYDGGKEAFGWWRRELADMAAVWESLLTEVDRRYKFVEKLKQRAAVLLSHQVPTIEDDIEELYEERSRFVHGQFHAQVAEQIAKNPDDIPTPDFELLRKHRERARLAVVAYLHLAQLLSSDPPKYPGMKSVIEILKKAVSGDNQVADRVRQDASEVLTLL